MARSHYHQFSFLPLKTAAKTGSTRHGSGWFALTALLAAQSPLHGLAATLDCSIFLPSL
jgi:hypothetical protein